MNQTGLKWTKQKINKAYDQAYANYDFLRTFRSIYQKIITKNIKYKYLVLLMYRKHTIPP